MTSSTTGALDRPGAPGRPALLTIALATVCVVAFLVRCLAIAEPLGIDQSLWASAVKGMSRGQLLYRDVWEQRPPGIYWIYLGGFQLLGWSTATVAWLDIAANAGTTLALWVLGRQLGDRQLGATAAALYAALSMPAWLFGYGGFLERSVCETFIALAVAIAACGAAGFVARRSLLHAALVGLGAGAAIVLKPNAGLYLPALGAWVALYTLPGAGAQPPVPRAARWRGVVVAAAAAMVIPTAALVWLWAQGTLHDARVAVLDFNRFYVTQGLTLGGYAIAFSKAVWLRVKTDPLWLAAAVASLVALYDLVRQRRLPPAAALALAWGGASALVIVMNGARLYNTYFLQAYPPLALLSAWLLVQGARGGRRRQLAAGLTAVLMLTVMTQRGYATRVLTSAQADWALLRGHTAPAAYLERFGSYANNRGYSARANAELADYLRAHTNPDERLFLFGINGAGVYFAADRLTAHRFLRVNFFIATDFPDSRFRLAAVTDELAAAAPRYLIFEQLHSASEMGKLADALPDQPEVQALLAGYHFERQIEDFALYRRND